MGVRDTLVSGMLGTIRLTLKGENMKLKFLAILVLALSSFATATITCPNGTAPNTYGFCGSYTAPMIACQTKTGVSCSQLPTGWTKNIGFYTTTPATGTVTSQFSGIAYSQLLPAGRGYSTPNANIAVGTADVLEYVNSGVQAFSKTKGTPFFITKGGTLPTPQLPSGPFASFAHAPLTASCGNLSVDVNVNYDHPGALYVLSGITSAASPAAPALCISTSPTLEGGGQSYWYSYGFDTTALRIFDAGVAATFDYPHLATFGGHYYVTMDYIDATTTSADYRNILGYVVCQLDRTSIVAGVPAAAAACYSYVPQRTTGKDALWHSLMPADMESTTVASGTTGPYFFAQLNPTAPGTQWYQGSPCYQNWNCVSFFVLSWSWSQITSGAAPGSMAYAGGREPGCYNPWRPDDTFCVSQPSPALSTDVLDAVSDRLVGRVPYRSASWNIDFKGTLVPQTELMPVAFTTGYYLTQTGSPVLNIGGPLGGTNAGFTNLSVGYTPPGFGWQNNTSNLWNPAIAVNKNLTIGVTFTMDNPGGTYGTPQPPSVYSGTVAYINYDWGLGPFTSVTQGVGVSMENSSGAYIPDWGNLVSAGVDPVDDTTFWGVNVYFTANEIPGSLTWATTIFKF